MMPPLHKGKMAADCGVNCEDPAILEEPDQDPQEIVRGQQAEDVEGGAAPANGPQELALERVICADCAKKCRGARGLLLHRRLKHPDKRAFQCPQCTLCMRLRTELAVHLRVHTTPRPYKCATCRKAFMSKHSLQQHMYYAHTAVKRYVCKICGQGHSSRAYLNDHLRRIHSGERPYKCTECGSAFVARYSLMDHLKAHIGFKDFVCWVCDRSFMRREKFKEHLRMHSGITPHRCPICRAGFGTSTSMRRHIRDVCKLQGA